MPQVMRDFQFTKTEQGLVVERPKADQCPPFFGYVLSQANIVVTGTQIKGSVTGSYAKTLEEAEGIVNLLLEGIEPFLRSIPSADLVEVGQIPKVNYPVRFESFYEVYSRLYKIEVVVRYVSVGNE